MTLSTSNELNQVHSENHSVAQSFSNPTDLLLIGNIKLYQQLIFSKLNNYEGTSLEMRSSIKEAFVLCARHNFDIAIFNISNCKNPELRSIQKFISQFPSVQTLIIIDSNCPNYISSVIKIGVSGVLSINSDLEELHQALVTIQCGYRYMDIKTTSTYLNAVLNSSLEENVLSQREIEVVQLLSNGMVAKEVANKLSLSFRTIEAHKRNIFRKLGLNNTTLVIKKCLSEGIIE